jgi:hypothetical protein
MYSIIFDTLQCSKRLQEAGFNQKQAEAQAEEIAKVINEQLTTKRDLLEMENRLTYNLTFRLGGLITAGITILGILHFFK